MTTQREHEQQREKGNKNQRTEEQDNVKPKTDETSPKTQQVQEQGHM